MLNVVAKRLLGEVSWGLKGRVVLGAVLSILDMATDAAVIADYLGRDETRGYGFSLFAMVVGSLVLQLFMVVTQNKNRPRAMAAEMLIVLTGLKPAFDCARVVGGHEMQEHHAFDAKAELVMSKGIEMGCESIPGAVLQLYAILKSGSRKKRLIGSVVVSALTTGVSSATISFDFDGKDFCTA